MKHDPHAQPEAAPLALTTTQTAALLNIAPKTLEELRRRGTGPVFAKVGRLVRYRLPDIENWLASRRRASTSASSIPPIAA